MEEYPFYNSLRIFIASPGDVKSERLAADDVISSVDIRCRDTLGIRAEILKWEDLPPLKPSRSEGRVQDVIIKELVQRCNIFVLILHKRYGSTSRDRRVSNTELEVKAALERIDRGERISFLTYFHVTKSSPDPGSQEKLLKELKKRLEERDLLYYLFNNTNDFKQRFTHDLYHIFLKIRYSTDKQNALRCFWRLGVAEGQSHPELAIIYPPVDSEFMIAQKPDSIWLERLVPHVVFEDFKALKKIDKTLRLVGHHKIKGYSSFSYPNDIFDINRVWLCLPRNLPGLKQFRYYEQEATFIIEPKHEHSETKIFWRRSENRDCISIISPLAKYLEKQREHIPGGNWKPEHGRIIAKDYAILARFSDKTHRIPTIYGTLKDYFVAGIRGLGTWGAAWFIDRRYLSFLNYESLREDEPIQLLLEITYQNEAIVEVEDVSDKPQSYFDDANNEETISRVIEESHGYLLT